MLQLILHLVGDYLTQSDWMAVEKRKSSFPAACHAILYALPFLLIGSVDAVVAVGASHFVIDRFGLARFVVWLKNFMGPRTYWHPWKDCAATGYPPERPAWLTVWLLIIADNTIHLLCNYAALRLL